MNDRLKSQIEAAEVLRNGMLANGSSSFAESLALSSIESHIDELKSMQLAEESRPSVEVIDFGFKIPGLLNGAMPLGLLAHSSKLIRSMVGHAALRVSEGGLRRTRVPDALYSALRLQAVGLLSGSSRVVITAHADRDLWDEGVAKDALRRIFSVLHSKGEGQDFLESIFELGVAGSRYLRHFLKLLTDNGSEMALHWKFGGAEVTAWEGTRDAISAIAMAIDAAQMREETEIDLLGVIEMLSKRERLQLRLATGESLRILYPLKMLPEVAKLHLDQHVSLRCKVVQTANPNTGETSTKYELTALNSDA